MQKIDILTPSLASGVIGYTATGDAMGFWIGSVGLWFALTALFVIAAALAGRSSQHSDERRTFEYAE